MTHEEKLKVLEANGWHPYYAKDGLVHKDIFTFLERMKKFYFGGDYTNYQYSIDEAFEMYLKFQKH
jgi:hypothetical protein